MGVCPCGCITFVSDRNAYMLTGALARRGYDWWWHSLTGFDATTAEARGFFIEYFSINPELGGSEAVLGQLSSNEESGLRPSYGMLNAGCWGPDCGPTRLPTSFPPPSPSPGSPSPHGGGQHQGKRTLLGPCQRTWQRSVSRHVEPVPRYVPTSTGRRMCQRLRLRLLLG